MMNWDPVPILFSILETIIAYLPRVVFAVATLALGWVFGRLVSFLINRIVGRMGLATAFRKTSVGRALLRGGYTPGSFFAALGKGVVYLFAALTALDFLSIPVLTGLAQAFVIFLPNLVSALLILLGGLILVDWIGETIEKGSSSTLPPALLSWFVRALLYFVVITIALAEMGVDVTILYIIAQALAWSLAIAIGIALGWNLKDRIGPWLEEALSNRRKNRKK